MLSLQKIIILFKFHLKSYEREIERQILNEVKGYLFPHKIATKQDTQSSSYPLVYAYLFPCSK